MNPDDLFTAPQVAKICSTDLKTIHNWVNRGEIKSFRTPGRHLRFRRQDILEFLDRFGYPVPDGFSPRKQLVIVYEEKDSTRRSLKRTLARDFEVEIFGDQVDALLAIGRARPSLVLMNGDHGETVLHMVRKLSAVRDSSPVVVYGSEGAREKAARDAGVSDYIPTHDVKEIRRQVALLLQKNAG